MIAYGQCKGRKYPANQPLYKQPPTHKKCSRCRKVLSIINFDPFEKSEDGYYSQCKPCRTQANELRRK